MLHKQTPVRHSGALSDAPRMHADTRTLEHPDTRTPGHSNTRTLEHPDTRTRGHSNTRTLEHSDTRTPSLGDVSPRV